MRRRGEGGEIPRKCPPVSHSCRVPHDPLLTGCVLHGTFIGRSYELPSEHRVLRPSPPQFVIVRAAAREVYQILGAKGIVRRKDEFEGRGGRDTSSPQKDLCAAGRISQCRNRSQCQHRLSSCSQWNYCGPGSNRSQHQHRLSPCSHGGHSGPGNDVDM